MYELRWITKAFRRLCLYSDHKRRSLCPKGVLEKMLPMCAERY